MYSIITFCITKNPPASAIILWKQSNTVVCVGSNDDGRRKIVAKAGRSFDFIDLSFFAKGLFWNLVVCYSRVFCGVKHTYVNCFSLDGDNSPKPIMFPIYTGVFGFACRLTLAAGHRTRAIVRIYAPRPKRVTIRISNTVVTQQRSQWIL